jgi:hypothetical protein
MSTRHNDQSRFLRALPLLFFAIAAGAIGWQFYLWFYYLSVAPRSPIPANGEVYPLQVHKEIVYLTKKQNDEVNGPWMLISIGAIAGAIITAKKFIGSEP